MSDGQIKVIVMTDETNTQVVIKTEATAGEDVETRFHTFAPEHAAILAESIIEAAKVCGYEEPPQLEYQRPFTDLQRLALIKRIEHVFRSLSGRKIDFICTHVVDTILAEIL